MGTDNGGRMAAMRAKRGPSQEERDKWEPLFRALVIMPYNLAPEVAQQDLYLKGYYEALQVIRDKVPAWAKQRLLEVQTEHDPAFQSSGGSRV